MHRVIAAIGLGSNLSGQRASPRANIESAWAALQGLPLSAGLGCSLIYRSPPLSLTGTPAQGDYANAVALLETGLAPLELLAALLAVERQHGRVRDGTRWGPRTLDLDILFYDKLRLDHADLRLPHPGMMQREFVLQPLRELIAQGQCVGLSDCLQLPVLAPTAALPLWE